jgi:Zn-dependent M28 family amino/carboxypeptidase
MISRLCQRGVAVRVNLKMEARDEGLAPSANVIAEIRGREKPDEVVVISGHFDSWDVGQGAQDDAGGCITAVEALNVLRKLDLRPRRTIRVVLFTNEENGLAGGKTYAKDHADELDKHVAAIESDSGLGDVRAWGSMHSDKDKAEIVKTNAIDIATLMSSLGNAAKADEAGSGADISPMGRKGVPCFALKADMTHYFDIHHTHADTIEKIDPKILDKHIASMAVMAYVLADMPNRVDEPATIASP